MNRYELYYNPSTPLWHFKSVMTHDEKVEFANTIALSELRANNYQPVHVDVFANMVRLNWMCFNVKFQPLVKPIVAVEIPRNNEQPDDVWQTIVGDTRLAAYELNGFTRIRAILQAQKRPNEPGWLKIENRLCLAITGGCKESDLMVGDWNNEPLEWIEFAGVQSQDHMHDQDQRFRMMCNYLRTQTDDFKFNKFWFLEPIDWSLYDH